MSRCLHTNLPAYNPRPATTTAALCCRAMSAFDLRRIGGAATLDGLVAEVRRAGAEAQTTFASARRAVEKKPDRSPVTAADRSVEARLRTFLEREVPQASFLGEESGAGGTAGAALEWLVDPIDGTRAFVRGDMPY